jgi:hypothetical protein
MYKLTWIEKHWSAQEVRNAKEWMLEAVSHISLV